MGVLSEAHLVLFNFHGGIVRLRFSVFLIQMSLLEGLRLE